MLTRPVDPTKKPEEHLCCDGKQNIGVLIEKDISDLFEMQRMACNYLKVF